MSTKDSIAARSLAESVLGESPDRPTAIARVLGAMGHLVTEGQDPYQAAALLAVLANQIDALRDLVLSKVAVLNADSAWSRSRKVVLS